MGHMPETPPLTNKSTNDLQVNYPHSCAVPDLLGKGGFATVLVQVREQADFVAIVGPQWDL